MTDHPGMSRRRLLKVGGLGALGLTLPALLKAEAARGSDAGDAASGRGAAPARSCILVFYYGGPSHLDTYDMKPKAPAEVRGQFGSIATSAPGLRVCEHLPHTARVMFTGSFRLNTIMGMLLSIQSDVAVESITFSP